jgi:hypothetical protein
MRGQARSSAASSTPIIGSATMRIAASAGFSRYATAPVDRAPRLEKSIAPQQAARIAAQLLAASEPEGHLHKLARMTKTNQGSENTLGFR